MVIEYLPKKVNKYSDMFRTIKNMTLDVMQKNEGVSMGATSITFVDTLPTGILNSFHGYLLYDVMTELYAGLTQAWWSRVRNIFTTEDILFSNEAGCDPQFRNPSVLNTVNSGSEVLVVPCKSYESQVAGNLFVYQEFDWRRAFSVKSNSGKLRIRMETGWIPDL